MTDPYTLLITITESSYAIDGFLRDMRSLQESIEAVQTQKAHGCKMFDEKKDALHDAQKRRDKLERLAHETANQMRQKQAAVSRISTDREQSALSHKYERLRAMHKQYEEDIFALWDDIALKEENVASYEIEMGHRCAEYDATIKEKERQLTLEEEKYRQACLARDALIEQLPADWRHWYDGLGEDAIIFAPGAQCTRCGAAIPVTDQSKIRRHIIVSCQGCHRILLSEI